jgi:hypothetical protein
MIQTIEEILYAISKYQSVSGTLSPGQTLWRNYLTYLGNKIWCAREMELHQGTEDNLPDAVRQEEAGMLSPRSQADEQGDGNELVSNMQDKLLREDENTVRTPQSLAEDPDYTLNEPGRTAPQLPPRQFLKALNSRRTNARRLTDEERRHIEKQFHDESVRIITSHDRNEEEVLHLQPVNFAPPFPSDFKLYRAEIESLGSRNFKAKRYPPNEIRILPEGYSHPLELSLMSSGRLAYGAHPTYIERLGSREEFGVYLAYNHFDPPREFPVRVFYTWDKAEEAFFLHSLMVPLALLGLVSEAAEEGWRPPTELRPSRLQDPKIRRTPSRSRSPSRSPLHGSKRRSISPRSQKRILASGESLKGEPPSRQN